MTSVHLLRYGETGRSVPLITATPQASASWEVHDLYEAVTSSNYVVASGAAAIDTLARSPSAAAGPGTANPRRIPISSTAGITVGATYLLQEGGRSELVEIAGLSTNAYVDARHPLSGTYSTAAALQGITITALLPDSIATTARYVDYEEPLRIVWTLASGERPQQQLRVVRIDRTDYDRAGCVAKIRKLFPNVHAALATDSKDPVGDLADTMADMLHAQILADGEEPERLLHGEQGQWLIVWKALHHLAMQGSAPGSDSTDTDRWATHCEDQLAIYFGNTRIGRAGARTVHVERVSESANGNTDVTSRARIRFY